MQCQNCGKETAGIKINEKLFCTNCGEQLLVNEVQDTPKESDPVVENDQTTVTTPQPKIISPDVDYGQIINDEEKEIDILEVEERVIDLIEKETEELEKEKGLTKPRKTAEEKPKSPKQSVDLDEDKKPAPKFKIVKHNRRRATTKFEVIPGEPNPITEPELPIPHDEMIEPPKELAPTEQEPSPIGPERENEAETKSAKKETDEKVTKNEALRSFFSKGIVEVSKKKRERKEKVKIGWKTYLVMGIVFLLVAIAGLVVYVNTIGNNAQLAVKKAEETADFSYVKPKYIPPGYELSYLTKASKDKISYQYAYLPDKNKVLSIEIAIGDWDDAKIKDKFLSEEKTEFLNKKTEETNVWFIGDKTVVFAKDNVLYQITSSDTISSDELSKIAEGIIK